MAANTGFDLTGKTALITGGRSGIGLAIARALRDHGATVAVTGVQDTADAGEAMAAEGFAFHQLDVRDENAVAALAAATPELDILVNSAGLVIRDEAAFESDNMNDVMDVNVTGTMRTCRGFFEHLKRRQGCIINIASMTTYLASPKAIGYGASKAAVGQLTKSLAVAWAPHGIRVNAISPGWVRTKLNQVMQDNSEFDAYITGRTPMDRWGVPEDIAGGAVYLASPAAAFVTGILLPIDGGFLAQ